MTDRYVYPSSTAGEEAWAAHGLQPPWTRVWKGGRDVTDEDPRTWPWPWSDDVKGRRR